MKPERIEVEEKTYLCIDDISCKLFELSIKLDDWMKQGYTSITVDNENILSLCKMRPETDEEYNKRLQKIEKEKLKKEKEKDTRRKQYKLLKKEFENEN